MRALPGALEKESSGGSYGVLQRILMRGLVKGFYEGSSRGSLKESHGGLLWGSVSFFGDRRFHWATPV